SGKQKSSARSFTTFDTACGIPLRSSTGFPNGVLVLANRAEGYDTLLVAELATMCETVAALLETAVREQSRQSHVDALQASEARLRMFVDHVTDSLFLQDADMRVVDVNRR